MFWGGREGYMSLLNTDMKREKEHMATMLTMARDYACSKGFKGIRDFRKLLNRKESAKNE